MLVKICGVSREEDAMNAIKHGADAIGFVMGGLVLPLEVEPHAQTVREIIKKFPKNVDSFLVTHLTNIEDILALSNYINSTGIQISEDIDINELKKIRKLTKKKIIKTVVVKDESSFDKLKQVEPYCDFILLDTRFKGYTGGTGLTSDWDLSRKMVEIAKKPVYLAGGLTPDNVLEAIKKVRPQGVDVSTGVGTYSKDYPKKDKKDERKIKKFIEISKENE